MNLQVRWHVNAYSIYDTDVEVEDEHGRLILRDNMWAAGWARVRDAFDGDADAYLLDLHREAIKAYFDTGLTAADWERLYSDRSVTVPPRTISLGDVARYHTINVHLGKGVEGARRLQALRLLAAQAGYYWNDEPSIGRWLSAIADGTIGLEGEPTPRSTPVLQDKIKALAEQQFEMWQALIEELDERSRMAQWRGKG
jgi:hypothetical protein